MIKAHGFLKNGEKISCTISLNPQEISLQSESYTNALKFSWDSVELSLGGAENKLIFFRIANDNSSLTSFYVVRNKENLAILAEYDNEKIRTLISGIKAHHKRSLGTIGLVLGSCLLAIFSIWATKDMAIDSLVNQIPYEWEQKLGSRLVGIALPANLMVRSGKGYDTLNQQVDRLVAVLPDHMKKVEVYISKSSEVNAFALPGGHIVFNEGLLHSAESMEEVLGVAAHELAHVQQRHVLRNLVQTVGLYFLVDLLAGDMTGIIAVISENSALLLNKSFSREHEEEADRVGYDILMKAEISPLGLLTFFRKLEDQKKDKVKDMGTLGDIEKGLDFLSTHPATKGRISAIKDRIAKDKPSFSKLKIDYESFKKQLSEDQKI